MHIEEDEQVGGAIALILAVVALKLARRCRDRLAYLADELGWTLVETDHRALRIGLFGIESEHILHAGDVLAIDLRNAPHVPAPGLDVVFGQPSARGLAGDTVVFGEPDDFTRQQLQGPTGAAMRWLGTGGRDQQGFLFAREFAACSRARLLPERRLHVAEHKTLLGPVDRRAADAHAGR